MRLFIRLIFCLLPIVAVALLTGCGSQQAASTSTGSPAFQGPRMAVDKDSFDLGKVPLDKLVNASFQIKNVGSAPLVLAGAPTVRAQVGC